MKTILLTGFEAFGTTPVNPAEAVVHRLNGDTVDGATVTGLVVPNTFFKAIDVVTEAMERIAPDAVVMMGEYGGRSMVTVERLAQNLNDGARYGLRDNDGVLLDGTLTVPDGPAAYVTTLPIRAMVLAMRAAGCPADISDSAGTFCCNHLMYGILHHIAVSGLPVRAGWIHLPHLPEVAARVENLGAPSMSADTAAEAVRVGLAAIVKHPEDTEAAVPSRLLI